MAIVKRLEELIKQLDKLTKDNKKTSEILQSIAEQFAKAADKNNEIIELLSEIKKLGTTNELIDKITNSIVENTKNQLKIELKEILKECSGRDIEERKRLIKEKGIEILKINKDIKLIDRFRAGGKAFIFEGLKKISEGWWVEPIVEAIKAFLEGES
ncbi:MAG: hypothetical protein QNJ65_24830 [Xenococcaceae cyanobacterium MO_234.B1]|nr:hypothetical protein [Xenococcaceae cyanobacterium MO_234.B1]